MKKELLPQLKQIIFGSVDSDGVLLSYKNKENSSLHLQIDPNEIQINDEEIVINSDTISAIFNTRDKNMLRDDEDFVFYNEYENLLITVI